MDKPQSYTPGRQSKAMPVSEHLKTVDQYARPRALAHAASGNTVYLYLCHGKAGYITPEDARRIGVELLLASVADPDARFGLKIDLDNAINRSTGVWPATV